VNGDSSKVALSCEIFVKQARFVLRAFAKISMHSNTLPVFLRKYCTFGQDSAITH
jgi:hypothetical protein